MHHDTRTKLKSIDLIHIWCYRFKDCGREGVGQFLWEKVNKVFDYMPLAAVIDSSIFCVHGGIPRPRAGFGMHQMLTAVQKIPVPLGICKLNRSGTPFSALCMLTNILSCWLQHHATKMNKIPMATISPWTWSGETLRVVHRCVYWDWGAPTVSHASATLTVGTCIGQVRVRCERARWRCCQLREQSHQWFSEQVCADIWNVFPRRTLRSQ